MTLSQMQDLGVEQLLAMRNRFSSLLIFSPQPHQTWT
jgi:hypothetical protein